MNKIYLKWYGKETFLFVLLSILFCGGLQAQNWEYVGSSTGISTGGAGAVNTVLSQDGIMYVSYHDTSIGQGSVQHFENDEWNYTGGEAGITTGAATYNSVCMDNTGNLYFTNQYGYPNSGMQVRQYNGTEWSALPMPTNSTVNHQTSAVTSSGMLLIGHNRDSGTVLRYENDNWEQVGNTGFAGGVPFFMDAVVGTNNKIYISFSNNGNVHVYENDVDAENTVAWTPTGGNANIAPASSSENYKSALAIDGNNNLYLAYVSNSAGGQKLNVKKYDGTSWTQLAAENFTSGRVQHVSIAVSTDGIPYVAVSNWENTDLLKNYVVGYNETTDEWEQVGDGYISSGEATYNSLQINADNHLLLAFHDSDLGSLAVMQYDLDAIPNDNTPVTEISPVTITSGFNHDIIANGVGLASASSDIGFDEVNSRALVSLDFQPSAGANFPTYGLPENGLINSAVTSGVDFQLADYSGNNVLFLTPDYVGTGTSTGTLGLTIENPLNLYLLAGMAGGGVQYLPLDVTLNFDDSTTQTAQVTVSDWYNGTDAAIQGMGRVNRANNALEGDASNPRLYEYTIAVDEANQNKTITSISFSFDGDQTATWGTEIRLSLLAVSAETTEAVEPAECTFTALSVTGFNHDIVAEGTGGNANEKTTHPIDGANAYYAQDFVPTNPHSSAASAAAYGGGLPNTGYIESSATEGLMYQVANYTDNNALVLRNTTTNTGTLTLTEQKKAEKLYIAWVSAEGGNNVDVVVNFTDNSSQTFSAQNASDWWSTSPDASTVVLGSIGRVSVITTAAWAPVNSFSGLTQTQLFQTEFLLDEENYDKLIESITFTKETSGNDATTTAVIALSICEVQDGQIAPTSLTISTLDDVPAEITTDDGTLQLEAEVLPEGAPQSVNWEITEGSEFATINNNGLVTAIDNGTITVTATSIADGTVTNTITITISNQLPEYCTPQFTSSLGCDNYRLRNVAIGDIDNDATTAACLDSDYLALSTSHGLGEIVDFSITLGNWMSFAIYADFNLDGDFNDEGEMLFAGHPEWEESVETVTNSFIMPSDITPGNYRMRVVAVWGDNAANPPITAGQACDVFNREGSGNFHDYTLVVTDEQFYNVIVSTQDDVPAEITTNDGTLQLDVATTPPGEDVVWSIVNGSEYALVSANGLVTALGNGTVTVRVALDSDASIYDEIEITITNQVIAVTDLTVSVQDDAAAEITTDGGTLQLIATITPENATNTNVTWTVESGSEFATVDTNGLVTANANGTVTVRATSEADDTIYDEIEITITNQVIAATGLTVNVQDDAEATITVENGTLQLLTVITPEDATDTEVTWSVESGSEFASVDANGLVTAIANGTATIRATLNADTAIYGEIEVVINIPLSTNEYDNEKLSVYPNPVSNLLYINTNNEVETVNIYNTIGQKVYTGNSDQVNLQNVQAGYYILQVQFTDSSIATIKIIKQ